MTEFTPLASTLGGVLIGLAAVAMLAFLGRIAGISGILGGTLEGGPGRSWRAMFLLGMVVGGLALRGIMPEALPGAADLPLWLLALAGLFVGFGTRLGGGCTSGHGVCGISRLSTRSVVATLIFMGTAAVTVFVLRHLIGLGAAS